MNAPIGVTGVMLPELDLDEQLALCGELGVTHYTLRPRIIPDAQRSAPWGNWGNHKFDLTPARLLAEGDALRRRMTESGVTPFGTVPKAHVNDSDEVLQMHFDGAAAVGAGRVRVMPGAYPQHPFDYDAVLTRTIEDYQRVSRLAQRVGVKIVIETHAGSLAASPALAWNIVRHFDPAHVGVIFDLPNFAREGGIRPVLAVSVLGPWIDHCHVGGSQCDQTQRDERGFRQTHHRMCALSDSDLHVPTWLAALREAGVSVPLVIEDYTADVPGAQRLRQSVATLRLAMEG